MVLKERKRWDTRVVGQLQTLVREQQPDILQSHNIKSHLFVRWLGLEREYPWVAFQHGYTSINLKDRIYNLADRWSLRRAFRLVAVCGPFKQRLARRGIAEERIQVQHNPVKPFASPSEEEVAAARSAAGVGEERVVLAVGRLSPEKGHADLFRAIQQLKRRRAELKFGLVLIGEGPEEQPLRRLAEELGLKDRIIFAGFKVNVRPFYSMATLLALPSHSEGSPNVVLEAMSAGLAIAATQVGGVPEILEQERTGLLVPPRDPHAMAGAIERLLTDETLRQRLGATARAAALEKFTPEAYDRSLIDFYETVLQDRRAEAAGR
jgi:glycosyltransferase involved in cell wall biosynthesis